MMPFRRAAISEEIAKKFAVVILLQQAK